MSLVLREAPGDGAGGAAPLLVDGDVQRAEVAGATAGAAAAAAAAVVGRRGEEDGDRGVGDLLGRRRRLAGDDVVLRKKALVKLGQNCTRDRGIWEKMRPRGKDAIRKFGTL